MNLSDPRFLTELRLAELESRRIGGGLLAAARLPMADTEAAGHRDYAPGDDWRLIDWPLCARHDELRTRRMAAEPDRAVYILVDCSASMGLGRPAKLEVARQVAAVLGWTALADLRQVVLAAFSDRILWESEPRRGGDRRAAWLRSLDRLQSQPGATSLAGAVRGFLQRRRAAGTVVVVSDWFDPAGVGPAAETLRRHGFDPRVVEIADPHDRRPPPLGDCDLVDAESGARWQFTLDESLAARYAEAADRFFGALAAYCEARRIPRALVPTDRPRSEVFLRAVLGKTA